MMTILEKWDPSSPNCVFKYYFYNKVDDNKAPFYGPSPNEDPKEWEEALSKKPGPGYIPALCTGFKQMGERIIIQQKNLAHYNAILHEINQALDAMLTKHDTETSIRALNAKRKHIALRQRSLALATKVQILRNRGYAMDGAEEALKAKLQKLEKTVCDPALNARGEEIWARMVGVRERARVLKDEMNKVAQEESIDAETQRRAEKVCLRFPFVVRHALTTADIGRLRKTIGASDQGDSEGD
jgi:nuclear pore complex protein Nup54